MPVGAVPVPVLLETMLETEPAEEEGLSEEVSLLAADAELLMVLEAMLMAVEEA